MKIMKFNFMAAALALISAIQIGFVSCSDDPEEENYYISTSEYASDFMQAREQYSSYVRILERATGHDGRYRLLGLLGTYGSYTVFAPTNNAVAQYIDSIYPGEGRDVESITKEDCDTIAFNSIIPKAYFLSDHSEDEYPVGNLMERVMYLEVNAKHGADSDETVGLDIYVNGKARIIQADDSVSNGVIHTVEKVVTTSNKLVCDVIGDDARVGLFNQAIKATGLEKMLMAYEDTTYHILDLDSVGWTNDKLVYPMAVRDDGSIGEYDNSSYLEFRKFGFTIFMESDDVFARYGITNLDELEAKAHELYDSMYPEDAGVTDRTDRKNALNRFISYHILPFKAGYYSLTCVDGDKTALDDPVSLPNCFWRAKSDISEWYETCMPSSIMKLSFPSGKDTGLYINRRGVQTRADYYGVKVRGAKVLYSENDKPTTVPLNAEYFYIDDIIAYDQHTQQVVLNERMRMDATTLSPDFITSGSRGRHPGKGGCGAGGRYTYGSGSSTALNNDTRCTAFKSGYLTNFTFEDKQTHIHIRPRYRWFTSYQGDEMIIKGRFDYTIKLPPVPAGEYELRFSTCAGFLSRGIMQAYEGTDSLNLQACGLPFDMRDHGSELYGFQSDNSMNHDEDQMLAFDKASRNLGWMKGPGNWQALNDGITWGDDGLDKSFRNSGDFVRRIICRFTSDGKTRHFLRVQQKMESEDNEMNFDFLEICPKAIFDNPYLPEDRY